MEIKRFIHNKDHMRELFGYIGEFAASSKVREALGGNISSTQNQVWFVALEDDAVMGFVSIIPHKNKNAKMVHLYSIDSSKQTEEKLWKKCLAEAKASAMTTMLTTDFAAREDFYKKRGWEVTGVKGRFASYLMEVK